LFPWEVIRANIPHSFFGMYPKYGIGYPQYVCKLAGFTAAAAEHQKTAFSRGG